MRRLCIALTWLAAIMTVGAQDNADLVHTVDAGETLISIANSYGVSLDELLTLNELDPDAILPIGRRLIIVVDGAPDDAEEQADAEAEAEEAAEAVISKTSLAGWPPAPVAAADAPLSDPADISPRLCFAIFADDNQNGMREPGEDFLRDGTILLTDEADTEVLQYSTDGQAEPYCLRDLLMQMYGIRALAPAGYSLTGTAGLRLDLREGGDVQLEFGAKQGLGAAVGAVLEPVAEADTLSDDGRYSILRELSGLFVLVLAGVVLFIGMLISVFLRGR